jgi:hypothetical protein
MKKVEAVVGFVIVFQRDFLFMVLGAALMLALQQAYRILSL